MPPSCVEEQIEPFILHSKGRSQVEKSSRISCYHSPLLFFVDQTLDRCLVVCSLLVVSHTSSQMNRHSDIYLRGSLSKEKDSVVDWGFS